VLQKPFRVDHFLSEVAHALSDVGRDL
jgi:hypothetical protein